MNNTKYLAFFFTITVLLIFSGCKQEAQHPVEAGHFENGQYQNELFGLIIELPKNWSVLSKKQTAAMAGVAKLAAGNDEKLQKQYQKQLQRTSMLLTAFMYPVPKTDGYNPSFGCTAENIKHLPGIKNGKDFLELIKNSISRGQVKATYPEQIQKIKINGNQFYMLPIESVYDNYSIKQKYYTTSKNGYILTFLATYESQKDYQEIVKIIKSIRLNK